MPINSVFVYADEQVLQHALQVENVPKYWIQFTRRPVSHDDIFDSEYHRFFSYYAFYLRGHMFDGRPIYCPTIFDVKEVVCFWVCTNTNIGLDCVRDFQRVEMDWYVRKEHPNSITLDQIEENEPFKPECVQAENVDPEKMQLIKRRIRRLVAVRVSRQRLDLIVLNGCEHEYNDFGVCMFCGKNLSETEGKTDE